MPDKFEKGGYFSSLNVASQEVRWKLSHFILPLKKQLPGMIEEAGMARAGQKTWKTFFY